MLNNSNNYPLNSFSFFMSDYFAQHHRYQHGVPISWIPFTDPFSNFLQLQQQPLPFLEMDLQDWNTDLNPLHNPPTKQDDLSIYTNPYNSPFELSLPVSSPHPNHHPQSPLPYVHHVHTPYDEPEPEQQRFVHPADLSPWVSPSLEYPPALDYPDYLPDRADLRFASASQEGCADRIASCADEDLRGEPTPIHAHLEPDAEGEDEVDDYEPEDTDDGDRDADPDFELDWDDGMRSSAASSAAEGRGLRLRSGKTARYTPYTASPTHSHLSLSTRTRCISTDSVSSSSSLPHLSYSPSPTSPGSPDTPIRRRMRPCTTIPVPVPVPNLTKKSRGRRVPTAASLEYPSHARGSGRHHVDPDEIARRGDSGDKGARMYMCKVAGCGKCFARGEHLKRHVRSIHTYEKPHKCPYPGCGKDFSRHDNLGQHMRVHKDYVMPKEGLGSLNGYRA